MSFVFCYFLFLLVEYTYFVSIHVCLYGYLNIHEKTDIFQIYQADLHSFLVFVKASSLKWIEMIAHFVASISIYQNEALVMRNFIKLFVLFPQNGM